MKYADFVDYSKLDPFKKKITKFLSPTFKNLSKLKIKIVNQSIGEPAVLLDFLEDNFYLAFKSDGVGTKNKIADDMIKKYPAFGSGNFTRPIRSCSMPDPTAGKQKSKLKKKLYSGFGIDLIAMNANDLICLGATPMVLSDEIAVGDSSWFLKKELVEGLLEGLKNGCMEAGITIPCGETPTLKDIIYPNSVNITGSMIGIIRPKTLAVLGQNIKAGNIIFGLKSNGIHSNGLTLARKIVENLPKGYFTKFNNITIGEELLKPTQIYVKPVLEMLTQKIKINYMTNITGSGFKKIMRHKKPFTYIINTLPKKPKVFQFLQEKGKINDGEAYQTWNMGVGFVIIAPSKFEKDMDKICKFYNTKLLNLGFVEKGSKKVVIKPLGITYES